MYTDPATLAREQARRADAVALDDWRTGLGLPPRHPETLLRFARQEADAARARLAAAAAEAHKLRVRLSRSYDRVLAADEALLYSQDDLAAEEWFGPAW